MAVGLTAAELREALRLGDSAEETAECVRLLAAATVLVEHRAPDAPVAAQNEAAVRLAAYLFDQPAGRYAGHAWALGNSGAAAILQPWRALAADETEADPA